MRRTSATTRRWPIAERLARATGASPELDAALAGALGVEPRPFTASAEECRSLAARLLPGWHLHVGYGASGVFPYAALSQGGHRHAAEAPTLPLAILRALVAAIVPEEAGRGN